MVAEPLTGASALPFPRSSPIAAVAGNFAVMADAWTASSANFLQTKRGDQKWHVKVVRVVKVESGVSPLPFASIGRRNAAVKLSKHMAASAGNRVAGVGGRNQQGAEVGAGAPALCV